MAHISLKSNIYHFIMAFVAGMALLSIVGGCAPAKPNRSRGRKTPPKTTATTAAPNKNKGKISSTPLPKADYDKMKKHVTTFSYGDTEVASIIGEAARWIGTPYRFGGTEQGGVDCSGLMVTVFQNAANRKLPRNSAAQQVWCNPVSRDSIRPGDLVFFATGSDRERVSHVGLYIGNDEIIHASTSRGVIISQLQLPYFAERYHSAGRPPFLTAALSETLSSPAAETLPPADLDLMIDEKVDSIFLDFFN